MDDIYAKLRERDPSLKWEKPGAVFRSYVQRQLEGPDFIIRVGFARYGLRDRDSLVAVMTEGEGKSS